MGFTDTTDHVIELTKREPFKERFQGIAACALWWSYLTIHLTMAVVRKQDETLILY